jgi:hypothetical protein
MLLGRIAGRGFDTDAVALAVIEAVTNVVRHAYSAPGGTVMLRAEASPDELVVVVADEGIGSRGDIARRNPGLGVGFKPVGLSLPGECRGAAPRPGRNTPYFRTPLILTRWLGYCRPASPRW